MLGGVVPDGGVFFGMIVFTLLSNLFTFDNGTTETRCWFSTQHNVVGSSSLTRVSDGVASLDVDLACSALRRPMNHQAGDQMHKVRLMEGK